MIDLLAISPHPDDAEIGCGGLFLLAKKKQHKTGILYLTAGEMGTGGTAEIRRQEIKQASQVLELDYMKILDFKDCQIEDNHENRLTLAGYIRKLKPKMVFIPYWDAAPGRRIGHTDHLTTGFLASHAVNFARLRKMPIPEEPHAVTQILYYHFPRYMQPTFIVDISTVVRQWVQSLKCHRSQMLDSHGRKTGFLPGMIARAKVMGYNVGCKFGQGFIAAEPLKLNDPFVLMNQ